MRIIYRATREKKLILRMLHTIFFLPVRGGGGGGGGGGGLDFYFPLVEKISFST